MAGIAGIAETGGCEQVETMLSKIAHRGGAGKAVIEADGFTMGAVWPKCQPFAVNTDEQVVKDSGGDGRLAAVQLINKKPFMVRGLFGIAPLYYGRTAGGILCFASEVKALLTMTTDVNLLHPGHSSDGVTVTRHFRLAQKPPLQTPVREQTGGLRSCLYNAVQKCVHGDTMGAWLSGGLDSSVMVALARPLVQTLHTFSVGVRGAPDLVYAREMAEHSRSIHHEQTVSLPEMLQALPVVIYHLESFDALLVRSSITNYLVAELASDHVGEVLSGEGGDELFAGYAYLKEIDRARLAEELIDITVRLHNTALQRVDRCAAAHGLVAYVPFLDHDVVDYALRIPVEFKIRGGVEKWILRQALSDLLPLRISTRTKAKFWEGAGAGELLADHAAATVTDADFRKERSLPNGWIVNTKEELMYYRIFKQHFGSAEHLGWMGRTKGAPKA